MYVGWLHLRLRSGWFVTVGLVTVTRLRFTFGLRSLFGLRLICCRLRFGYGLFPRLRSRLLFTFTFTFVDLRLRFHVGCVGYTHYVGCYGCCTFGLVPVWLHFDFTVYVTILFGGWLFCVAVVYVGLLVVYPGCTVVTYVTRLVPFVYIGLRYTFAVDLRITFTFTLLFGYVWFPRFTFYIWLFVGRGWLHILFVGCYVTPSAHTFVYGYVTLFAFTAFTRSRFTVGSHVYAFTRLGCSSTLLDFTFCYSCYTFATHVDYVWILRLHVCYLRFGLI